MISTTEFIYRKGSSEINEDTYVVNQKQAIFAVIDGATGLGGLSGSIASGIISNALQEEKGTIFQRVLKGNSILAEEVVKALQNPKIKSICDIEKQRRSCCAMAAIELSASSPHDVIKMNYVTAADCLLFVQYQNGHIHQVNYDDIDYFDQKGLVLAKEQWKDYLLVNEDPNKWESLKISQTLQSIREKVNPILQDNRCKLNTSKGYGIIDGSQEAGDFLAAGTIPLVNVRKILLLTDGLKIHSHRNRKLENEWLYSARLAFEHGLAHLENTILEIEENDPSCYEYPRFKQHDDKTGILIHLES
ncbi:hypothetical protein QNH39_25810 [Neobacillus novalis]|uniref:Protein phosphatase 2C domain-containing protein n=1 Tax=Neobacillus novalis TaxID=220687 RepID=A0AA95MLL4_9BACI|nr:hypothetical protein [Neobacillus novalis]WHY85951.1 hypothetical protein QNH39_25810 [Neobacillus novalis]